MNAHTTGPWSLAIICVVPDDLKEAARAKGIDAEDRPFRENDGSFVIMAGAPDEERYRRVGTACLQVNVKRERYRVDDPEALANAHMFAAAPELRQALREVLNAYVAGWDRDEHSDIGGSIMRARTALAKAEGRS